jgi:hypothetical protein
MPQPSNSRPGPTAPGRRVPSALADRVRRGEYVVDVHAVAEAILASGVLVAAQPFERAMRPEQDQPATG